MGWFSLTNEQMVSFTDGQEGGFLLKAGQSHVTSNQCMTKTEAFAKYDLTATTGSNSITNGNQLMQKSFWQSVTAPASATGLQFPELSGVTSPYSTIIVVRTTATGTAITTRKIYYSTTDSTPNAGSPFFSQSLVAGTITTSITGLTPNTGYYFSLYVADSLVSSELFYEFKIYTSA